MLMGKDFDFDSIRRARARKGASTTDLVAAINAIAPDIEKLKVGETARIDITGDKADPNRNRKAVMAITAKLNNLTPKGGKWQGKVFRVISDEDYIYVQRGKNEEPKERKRGGRKLGSTNASKGGDSTVTPTGARVTEHA